MSAINAIMQPFSFKSTSTQIESPVHQIRLGGREVSVFNLAQNKSITKVIGGTLLNVTYRIRKGKTARERAKNKSL